MSNTEMKTHYRACNLCEAVCGIEIKTQGAEIISIKGDKADPLGRGHICPKAVALQDIYTDPDRLKQPVQKVNGKWQEISWEDAFDKVANGVHDLQNRHGKNALAIYAGNPNVHNYGSLTHGSMISRLLGSKNRFSSTSLDLLPLQLMCRLMYGHQLAVPISDLDNCDYFVAIGANPVASNGSMMTVPDFTKRIKSMQARNGEFVVLDPRRTETAAIADLHHHIKPGSDIYLLLAMINHLFDADLVKLGHLSSHLKDIDTLRDAVQDFSLALAEHKTGIATSDIDSIARKLSDTPRASLYGRMGISTQQHGSLCNWAIQIINILCGNLDVVGGTLLSHPAFGKIEPGASGAGNFGRWVSRVNHLPEFNGELPATEMTDEMLTPGEGQAKGLFLMAGNPVSSSPNGRRLDEALEQLEFIVAIDFYVNETTRHADIILPPTMTLEHDHFDIAFLRLAVRNTIRFNEPVFEPETNTKHDWQIFNAIGERLSKLRDVNFKAMPAPDSIIEYGLRKGDYSVEGSATPKIDLAALKANPHGIDLGPLKPSFDSRICTDDGLIHCMPQEVAESLANLSTEIKHEETKQDEFLLIGRRHIRDCNSWMHNSNRLVKGKDRSALLVNPIDLERLEISDGEQVNIQSAVGTLQVAVQANTDMMSGVVSLPHGFGHKSRDGVMMSKANSLNGVNCNDLTDDQFFDAISGTSALNGVPVSIRRQINGT